MAASLLQPFGLPKGRRDVEKEKETPNLCPAWQSAPPSVYFSVPFLSRAIWASKLEEKLASGKASGLVFGDSVPCRGRQSTLEPASATERGTGSPSRGGWRPRTCPDKHAAGPSAGSLRHAPAPASRGRNPRGRAEWTARPPVNPRGAVTLLPLPPRGTPVEAATQTGDDRTEANPPPQTPGSGAGAPHGWRSRPGHHPPLAATSRTLLTLTYRIWVRLLYFHLTPSPACLVLPIHTGLLYYVSPGH